MMGDKILDAGALIDALGGNSVVADMLGIRQPSVCNWRLRGIPDQRLMILAPQLEHIGLISRKELFPDNWQILWPELRKKPERHKINKIPDQV